jgi:hypothetical protein
MKVTKWSILLETLTVSDQNAEQTSGESASLSAGSAASFSSVAQSQPVTASPDLVPGQGDAGVDAPNADVLKAEVPEAEASKADAPKADAPNTDAPKAEAPRFPGKVMIMSAGDRSWADDGTAPEAESESKPEMFGKRRFSALAAVVALATVAGALGGALATAGLTHFVGGGAAGAADHALEASVARIDADVLALKASVEHTSKLALSQYNRASERLDKVEKAQVEPAAKLAKLSEAVDKLRATPPAVPVPAVAAPAAAKEVTGSIAPAAVAPKAEVGRLPTVEGWALRNVANGGALIESRRGIYEVYAGDPVPGLGRIDAIRRQDGRWVVVTSKGLIVAR